MDVKCLLGGRGKYNGVYCVCRGEWGKLSHTPFPPKPGRCWFRAGSNSGTSSFVFHTKKAGSGSIKQVRSQHQLLGGPETRTGDVGVVPRLWAELPHQNQIFSPPFFFHRQPRG